MVNSNPSILLWFDTEFSDLNVEKAALMQVAVLATDFEGNRLLPKEEDINLVVRPPLGTLFSEWVQENLAGLIDQCNSPVAVPLEEADRLLHDYAEKAGGGPHVSISDCPVLAGNSVHMDYVVARTKLPTFYQALNYRLLDVSGIKLVWEDAHPGNPVEKESAEFLKTYGIEDLVEGAPHDAYYDIQASIAEYRFYRKNFLRIPD
jgi:oligoribonuclease (3'-5' exoribonuclease)